MKKILVSLMMVAAGAMAFLPMVSMVFTGEAHAANSMCDDAGIDEEARRAAGCKVSGTGTFGDTKKTVVPIVLNVMNVVLTLVGLVAVIVIIYGGILYVISTGDTSRTTKAKNCILYGVVGLVVALMSYAIVAFINTSVLQK